MAAGHSPEHPSGASPPPASHYLDWAIRTGFRYQRPGDWIPLLVEYRREAVVRDSEAGTNVFERFQKLEWLGPAWRDFVKIPEVMQTLPKVLQARSNEFDFCVVLISGAEAQGVVDDSGWRKTIRSAELSPPFGESCERRPQALLSAPLSRRARLRRLRQRRPRSKRATRPGGPGSNGSQACSVSGVPRQRKRLLPRQHNRWSPKSASSSPCWTKASPLRTSASARVARLVLSSFGTGWTLPGKLLGTWTPGTELTASDIKNAIDDFFLPPGASTKIACTNAKARSISARMDSKRWPGVRSQARTCSIWLPELKPMRPLPVRAPSLRSNCPRPQSPILRARSSTATFCSESSTS